MSAHFRGFVCALASVLFGGVTIGAGFPIQFRTERAGFVSLNIYRSDGTLVRPLLSVQRFPAGVHKVVWDGEGAEPGEYFWRGLFHEGVGLKLRGWAAHGGDLPWEMPDGTGTWGGTTGVPSAVAADEKRVYLGWSRAGAGNSIVACDLEGRAQWTHRRTKGESECASLAVDEGVVYVLGGREGDSMGDAMYKLSAKDGKPVPWPNGAFDLKITALWPADSTTKPDRADAMAVRHGHIYLTFTNAEFIAVLEAKTGDYLQTVVGAPPGMIDVVATQSDLPDAPGKLVDADFAVISLGGGVLGKVLFAHDPVWVLTSELTPMEREVNITALSVIGDAGKFHRHEAFVGLGAPFHQVQARPLLDTEGYVWSVGRPGGRPLLGPWVPESLRAIRSVALDASGRLWVAESDAFPQRISVWDTTGKQGTLVREFFGPATGLGGAINPLDPDLMFGQGCEWRLDRKTGRASCLGVVTREFLTMARYAVGENGRAYLVVREQREARFSVNIFERVGDGDYHLRARIFDADKNGEEVTSTDGATQTMIWSDENGDGLSQRDEAHAAPGVVAIRVEATAQDLTLQAERSGKEAAYWLLRVKSWTACGAPRYEFAEPHRAPEVGPASADGRLILGSVATDAGGLLSCREVATGRELWRRAVTDGEHREALPLCSAHLDDPIRNVWLVKVKGGTWHLVNEDGFDVAQFLEGDAVKVAYPARALPGADMTRAKMPDSDVQTMAQAVDGKLYLQAGESAYWNLEVTGLDKVKALPGGKIVIPLEGRAPARP